MAIIGDAKIKIRISQEFEPPSDKGWVVRRFSPGAPASYLERNDPDFSPLEEAIRCSVPPEGRAQAWLREHDGNFSLKSMTADTGDIIIAGILS